MHILEFEKPIYEVEAKIEELRSHGDDLEISIEPEIRKLQEKLEKLKAQIYKNLSVWQRVQIARHPDRPYTLDYIDAISDDFVELHGDRQFADDLALIAGFATIEGHKVMILGHQKGRDTNENVKRNFGCAHPEGYRKAMRVMELAAKFRIPVVALIDTPGAYPGIGAEERGQAQAIAENLRDMSRLNTPVVAVVIGEGGSGGAIGIGVANRVLILEHAYYSVISPEGCASILWRSAEKAPQAAEALKITGEQLLEFGVVDEVIEEPKGGAHRDTQLIAERLKAAVVRHIRELNTLSSEELLEQRYQKFRQIGMYQSKK